MGRMSQADTMGIIKIPQTIKNRKKTLPLNEINITSKIIFIFKHQYIKTIFFIMKLFLDLLGNETLIRTRLINFKFFSRHEKTYLLKIILFENL